MIHKRYQFNFYFKLHLCAK